MDQLDIVNWTLALQSTALHSIFQVCLLLAKSGDTCYSNHTEVVVAGNEQGALSGFEPTNTRERPSSQSVGALPIFQIQSTASLASCWHLQSRSQEYSASVLPVMQGCPSRMKNGTDGSASLLQACALELRIHMQRACPSEVDSTRTSPFNELKLHPCNHVPSPAETVSRWPRINQEHLVTDPVPFMPVTQARSFAAKSQKFCRRICYSHKIFAIGVR